MSPNFKKKLFKLMDQSNYRNRNFNSIDFRGACYQCSYDYAEVNTTEFSVQMECAKNCSPNLTAGCVLVLAFPTHVGINQLLSTDCRKIFGGAKHLQTHKPTNVNFIQRAASLLTPLNSNGTYYFFLIAKKQDFHQTNLMN